MCTKFHCSAKENFLMWCFLEIIIYLLIVDQCVEDADSTWLPLLLFFFQILDLMEGRLFYTLHGHQVHVCNRKAEIP